MVIYIKPKVTLFVLLLDYFKLIINFVSLKTIYNEKLIIDFCCNHSFECLQI